MNAVSALARLTALGVPVVRTSEAAAVLGQSREATSKTLHRLAQVGLLRPLRHGMAWIAPGPVDPMVALEYLTSPYPAYVSLHSALYLRGAVSQVPEVTYAASLARAQRIRTAVGTFSIHHVSPELFGGFETLASGAKLATVEKALFDLASLSVTRNRTVGRPPELDLPRTLDRAAIRAWVRRVSSTPRRIAIERRLSSWGVGVHEPPGRRKRPG